jgi:putative transposase
LDGVVISVAGRKHGLRLKPTKMVTFYTKSSRTAATSRLPGDCWPDCRRKKGLTPKRIITDKLRSYGAVRRDVMPGVEHRSHKGTIERRTLICHCEIENG